MRKMAALVLTALMVLTLSATASAEHGSIVVKGAAPVTEPK